MQYDHLGPIRITLTMAEARFVSDRLSEYEGKLEEDLNESSGGVFTTRLCDDAAGCSKKLRHYINGEMEVLIATEKKAQAKRDYDSGKIK